MCGIFGIVTPRLGKISDAVLSQMGYALQHRGPDDKGIWQEEGVTLGQTRLSILDLSPAGHQPMLSASNRFVLTLNGEIYNHTALKRNLEKHININFRGHSDTEVFLECLEHLGVEMTLQKAIGMFAFALWDRKEKRLFLGRDRFGEKPLYWGMQNNIFAFTSELGALKPLKGLWDFTINKDVLKPYVRHGYIPGHTSIFKHIYKLEPGTFAWIDQNLSFQKKVYWSAMQKALEQKETPLKVSFKEAEYLLEQQLKETINLQKVADVPVGTFLSGGIDSSLIVALLQDISQQPIKTFTIGFHEKEFNEAPFAKQVAAQLGTDHTEVYLTQKEAIDIVTELPRIYSEPFADSSQIPTFLVSRVAKQKVTVCISGDGGDEIFGGYERYFQSQKLWELISRVPASLRPTLIKTLRHTPQALQWKGFPIGDKTHKFLDMLSQSSTRKDMYLYLISAERHPNHLVIEGENAPLKGADDSKLSFAEWMMLTDTLSYLTDDILVKVDRAAMANSLETRVPFLDHRVFELAWRLPFSYKMQGTQGKVILKSLLEKYLPRPLIDRPKMGFGIPYGQWLRHDLKEWGEDLLNPATLKEQNLFNAEQVHLYWTEHLENKRQWQNILWNLLMFQAWLKKWNEPCV